MEANNSGSRMRLQPHSGVTIPFNENCIAIIITLVLTLMLGVNGPLQSACTQRETVRQKAPLGPVYTKHQHQCGVNVARSDTALIDHNRVAPKWVATPFSCDYCGQSKLCRKHHRSVDADAWCKRALTDGTIDTTLNFDGYGNVDITRKQIFTVCLAD